MSEPRSDLLQSSLPQSSLPRSRRALLWGERLLMVLSLNLVDQSLNSTDRDAYAKRYAETVVCPESDSDERERPELLKPTQEILQDFSVAFKRTRLWVVSVGSGELKARPTKNSPNRVIFTPKRRGSGVIWGKEKLILTNAHVIGEPGDELRAQSYHRHRLKLDIVGVDRQLDLALLRPQDPEQLRDMPAACYLIQTPSPGERVAAVGHPYSMPYSISTGAVSAIERGAHLPHDQRRRWRDAYPGFIQSDLMLNPGNSGGPLIDQRGVMLGLNTLIYRETNQDSVVNTRISFTLPMSRILPVVEQLKSEGSFKRSYIGLKLSKLSYERGYEAHLKPRTGVRVKRVASDGPAARAGLRADDIILSVNGEAINHYRALSWRLIATPAGVPVVVEFLRMPNPPYIGHVTLVPSAPVKRASRVESVAPPAGDASSERVERVERVERHIRLVPAGSRAQAEQRDAQHQRQVPQKSDVHDTQREDEKTR